MPLELRLLGPLEVRRDGAPVRLPAKQRTLLAELVLGRGRVVSVDRLIESLWPDKRPADARHALEMHAYRLRGLLGQEAAVEARAPGYLLEVDHAQVDVDRFEQLLADARELLDDDPSRAAARAGDAIALWRGSALADFAYEPFAQEEIARLEELRLEAEDARIEAELRLGRSSELIGEIEALVAGARLRERRREHLMVALYRAGRQADALDVYTEIRTLLNEELGLEPGEALRDLQQSTGEALVGPGVVSGPLIERARRIARDGSADEADPPLRRRADGPFVGRTDELARLRNARAALVVGPPGIGKSRLAAELSGEHRVVSGRCPAFGAPTALPLREIARQLGAAAELDRVPADEVPLTVRRLCERSAPLLVVIDDVQWASELVIETVEQLVARAAGDIRVLCLAREELLDDRPGFMSAADRLELGPLSEADAADLATALGAHEPSLAERAEGNPLFIEQLLAHSAESDEPLPSSLESLLVTRLDRLPPIERLVVTRAAVVGREFGSETVGHLLDGPSPRRALASLARRGFLDLAPGRTAFEERFRFRHGLIYEAAYRSIPKAERSRLHEVVADLLDTGGATDELVGFHLEQAAVLRPDHDRHARRLSEDAGRRLATAGITRWKRQDAHGTVRLLDRAMQLLPADDAPRAELLCELASAVNTAGDRVRALELLEEARRSPDGRIRLRAELEHAAVSSLVDAGDVGHVLEVAIGALPVFEGVGDDRSLGRAWMLAGWVRGGALGRHEEWLDATERALACYRRAGWPVSTVIGHTAAALYLGPTPVGDGIERCRTLLEFEVADLASEASVYAHLGGLHAMGCDFDGAEDCLLRAYEIYTDLGRRPSLLATWAPIAARSARLHGDLEKAAELYVDTCEELVAAHAGFHLATQAAEVADLLCELERFDEAATWASLAERHARRGDREGSAYTLIARAQVLAHEGRKNAEDRAREAVALTEETDELNLRGAARLALAVVLARRDEEGAAAERLRAVEEYKAKGNVAAAQRVELDRTAATSPGDAA